MTATLVPAPDVERDHRFTPRRVRFDYALTPVHWVPGDPHTTHVANVLHLLLPAGEGWFVDVYRKALPLIEDERLRRDVKAFIGQEATRSTRWSPRRPGGRRGDDDERAGDLHDAP